MEGNQLPALYHYNKNHLSRDCAAGIDTNGASVVPGIHPSRQNANIGHKV